MPLQGWWGVFWAKPFPMFCYLGIAESTYLTNTMTWNYSVEVNLTIQRMRVFLLKVAYHFQCHMCCMHACTLCKVALCDMCHQYKVQPRYSCKIHIIELSVWCKYHLHRYTVLFLVNNTVPIVVEALWKFLGTLITPHLIGFCCWQ